MHGCDSIITVTVYVNQLPVVEAHATSTVVCAGTNVTLTGSGAGTYTWSNGVIDGVGFAPTTSQTYSLEGTDANNCVGTTTVIVNVNALPVVTFTATGFADSLCVNTGIQTFNGGFPLGGTYSGDGVLGITFSPVTAGLGNHIITYSYTNANNCSNTATHTIVVKSCNTGVIEQLNENNGLTVYPNPNSGNMTISCGNKLGLISVYNAIGELVYQVQAETAIQEINISAMRPGVYMLELQGQHIRVIKE
jgi:hypothetical protein